MRIKIQVLCNIENLKIEFLFCSHNVLLRYGDFKIAHFINES